MRILILLRDGSRNGITTYNRVLAQALRSQGHSVSVWPQPDALPAVQTLQALCLHPWSEPVLRHVVGRLAPDLVFVSHYSQARLAQRLRETMGIPWFARMHNGHWLDVRATATRALHCHDQPSEPSVLTVQVSVASPPSMPADNTPTLVKRP